MKLLLTDMKKGNPICGLRLVNNDGNRAPQIQDMMVRLN